MANLQLFTVRACADAKWVAKRDRFRGTRSLTSSDSPPPLPRSIRPRRSDDESLACKARLVSLVLRQDSYVLKLRGRSYFLCQCLFHDLPTRILCCLLSGLLRWRHSSTHRPPSPVLPRPASTWMLSVPSVPGRVSVILWCHQSVSVRESVSSVDSGDNVQSDLSLVMSQFQPLNQPHSPVDMSSNSQVVMESPTQYEVLAEPFDIYTAVDRVAQLSGFWYLASGIWLIVSSIVAQQSM